MIKIGTSLSDVYQRIFRFLYNCRKKNVEKKCGKCRKKYRFYKEIKFTYTSSIWKYILQLSIANPRIRSHSPATLFHVVSQRRDFLSVSLRLIARARTRTTLRIRLADCCEPGFRWWRQFFLPQSVSLAVRRDESTRGRTNDCFFSMTTVWDSSAQTTIVTILH